MTVQLATRVDSKAKEILGKLHKKTHIPISKLTEKAILLLDEYYAQLQKSYKESDIDSAFMHLLDYSIKKHDKTYEKLAK